MNVKFVGRILLFLILCQEKSFAMNLTIIHNAMFNPLVTIDLLRNLSHIQTRNLCICQCYGVSNCIIVNYNGYREECILFSAILQMEQIRVVSMNENASVVVFNDRNEIQSSPSTISISYTNALTTAQNDLCSVPTNPIRTYTTLGTSNYVEEIINYQASFTGTAILEFGFQAKNPSKVWHLDDVSIIDTNASNVEMLINGDFELASLQHWRITCGDTNCGGIGGFLGQSDCHTGFYCYKGACQSAYDFLQQSFNVTNGHVYKLTFWINTDGHPQQAAFVNIYQG